MADMAAYFQEQRDRILSHCRSAICGHIADCNPTLLRGCRIYYIIAGRKYSNKFKIRTVFYHSRRDGSFVCKNCLSIPNTLYCLFLRLRPVIDRQFPVLLKRLPA